MTDRRTDQASLERAQSIAAVLQKSPVPQFKDTLGWISYRRGDYGNAVPLLEQAAAELPNRAVVHYHLGMAYSATKQVDKAVEQFNAALNQTPDPELKAKIQAAIKKSAS
jgi:tetratricopeptide (TPR) repeat protein